MALLLVTTSAFAAVADTSLTIKNESGQEDTGGTGGWVLIKPNYETDKEVFNETPEEVESVEDHPEEIEVVIDTPEAEVGALDDGLPIPLNIDIALIIVSALIATFLFFATFKKYNKRKVKR